MARGGYRPGAGRKKGAGKEPKAAVPADIRRAARAAKLTPLDYMLGVLNDDDAALERRDRMAIAAAPFCHARRDAVGGGKKEDREQAAKDAATGKYAAPPAPPKLVVNNS
jgi:hypothetical protein